MSTKATTPYGNGETPPLGKRKKGEQHEHGRPVRSAQQFGADVALKLGRAITNEELATIMSRVQESRIRLAVDDADWQKAVLSIAEEFDPLLGIAIDKPSTAVRDKAAGVGLTQAERAQAADLKLQQQFPKANLKEVKGLIKLDPRFLEQLNEFAEMTDEALGKMARPVIEQMSKHNAAAQLEHEKEKQLFRDNLPMFFDIKMRLLDPKYRPDLAGAEGRSVEANLKHYGAANWVDFHAQYVAYSLSQADKLLKAWHDETKRLSDGTLDGAGKGEGEGKKEGEGEVEEKNKRREKELNAKEVQTAYKADLTDKLLGLLNNSPKGTPAEQIIQKVQALAQYEFEALTPEEQDKCKMPKIKLPTNTVEKLGIEMAKFVFGRIGKGYSDAQREELDDLATVILQAAGVEKVGKTPVPAKITDAEAATDAAAIAAAKAANATVAPTAKAAASASEPKADEAKAS
jgi:hypothetical protein